jgi:hypothetical protein
MRWQRVLLYAIGIPFAAAVLVGVWGNVGDGPMNHPAFAVIATVGIVLGMGLDLRDELRRRRQ